MKEEDSYGVSDEEYDNGGWEDEDLEKKKEG